MTGDWLELSIASAGGMTGDKAQGCVCGASVGITESVVVA